MKLRVERQEPRNVPSKTSRVKSDRACPKRDIVKPKFEKDLRDSNESRWERSNSNVAKPSLAGLRTNANESRLTMSRTNSKNPSRVYAQADILESGHARLCINRLKPS